MNIEEQYKYGKLSLYFHNYLNSISHEAKYLHNDTFNDIIDETIQQQDINYSNIIFEEKLFNKYEKVRQDVLMRIKYVVSSFCYIDNALAVSELIINNILSTCLTKYSYKEIISGKLDDKIEQMYFNYFKILMDVVCGNLKLYVDENINFEFDYNKLEDKIINDVLVKNNLSFNDMVFLSDKAKSFIKMNAYNFSDKKEVMSSVDLKRMAESSIAKNDSNDEIKYNSVKKVLPKAVSILLLTTLILTVLRVGHKLPDFVDDVTTDISYNYANYFLEDNRYDFIFTKYNENFTNNAMCVLSDYDNYSKYGEEYGYLGFYEAYKHVMQDRLSIMDSMLELINIRANQSGRDIKINDRYFVSFAFNRLVNMGCEEISESKYEEAVNEYIDMAINIENDDFYKNQTVMDVLNNKPEVVKNINKIMELYDKYSARAYSDLVKNIGHTARR